ncbi:unnamed protein product, partial [Didymodactylos carnosus]
NKIREFDEKVSTLKDENLELRKRIDQLEELCSRHVIDHRCELLELHISKLEDENLRLFNENCYQRKQYEMFLENVTQMVFRTLLMQQNIRKECNEIYQIINDLSKRSRLNQLSWCGKVGNKKALRSVSCETINSKNINSSSQTEKKKSLFGPCELTHSCIDCHLRRKTPSTTTTSDILKQFNSDTKEKQTDDTFSTSSTTLRSFSATQSWALDLSFYDKESTFSTTLSNASPLIQETSKEDIEQNKEEKRPIDESNDLSLCSTGGHQLIQRSETFVIEKASSLKLTTTVPMPVHKPDDQNSKIQRCSTTRALASSTTNRTSRLPYRRTTATTDRNTESSSSPLTKFQLSQTNSLSSAQKSSRLPVLQSRIKQTPKTPISAPIKPVTKKVVLATRTSVTKRPCTAPIHTNYLKRTSIPPRIKSKENTTARSRSSTASTSSNPKRTKTSTSFSTSPSITKTAKAISWTIATTDTADENKEKQDVQMNTTSSESSIEEKHRLGDEGYSTMSSDIRDVSFDSLKRNTIDNESDHIVNNWLNTNSATINKPVKQQQTNNNKKNISIYDGPVIPADELEQFKKQLENDSNVLCPFVRTNRRTTNQKSIPVNEHIVPTTLVKDLSVDSLDEICCHSSSSDGPQQTISSRTTTNSTIDENDQTLPRSETFDKILTTTTTHMECNTDEDDIDSTDSTYSDINQLFLDYEQREAHFCLGTRSTHHPIKPEKRLVFPGILGRLLILRRVLSDSDIYRKVCLREEELCTNVYHMDTIREHSIELNLLSTYGSETELRAWSKDCWETRFAEYRAMFGEDEEENHQHRSTPIPMGKYDQNDIDTAQVMCLDDDEDDDDDELSSLNFIDEQQIAIEQQQLLQQIYEYPWSYDDLDNIDYSLSHPSSKLEKVNNDDDLIPSLLLTSDGTKQQQDNLLLLTHDFKSDFYQLCALTASSSFAYTNTRSNTPNSIQTTSPISNSSTSSSSSVSA